MEATGNQSFLGPEVDLEKVESPKSVDADPESRVEAQYQPRVSRHTTRHTAHDGYSAHRAVTAQDWSGPEDPENPRNWPKWKQYRQSILPGLFAFSVYVARDSLEAPLTLDAGPLDLLCTHQATAKLPRNSTSQVRLPYSACRCTSSAPPLALRSLHRSQRCTAAVMSLLFLLPLLYFSQWVPALAIRLPRSSHAASSLAFSVLRSSLWAWVRKQISSLRI